MKRIIGALAVLSCFAWPAFSKEAAKCIEEISVTRGESPWQGFTGSHQEEAAAQRVRAEALNRYESLPHLAKYAVKGAPLMGRSEALKRVAVDGRFFSDLTRGDATRIAAGESKTIGRFLDLSFASLPPRSLAKFLIEAQIIQTYWHLESKLCLFEEKESPSEYAASFKGEHSYCTNECVDAPLRFGVRIDKRSGEIRLTGL